MTRSDARPQWRLGSVSQRTILWYDTARSNQIKRQPKKSFRNPIILAREMPLMMEMEELSRAELARKLGLSRARVTQILNLLGLCPATYSSADNMARR